MEKKSRYTLSNLQKGWGEKYDKAYTGDNYDTRVWELEKKILKKILRNKLNDKCLDFACATGRISKYLEELGFRDITCMDASPEMLKEARKKLKKSLIVVQDISKPINSKKIKKNSFDTILAFRFFLNAEKELRREAIKKLDSLQKSGGEFIFNIHGNKRSPRFFYVIIINFLKFFLQRKKRKDRNYVCYRNQLSVKDMKKLLKETDFFIKKIYSYAFLPKIFVKFLKRREWIKIEEKLISNKRFFGTHLLFVCEKKKKQKKT